MLTAWALRPCILAKSEACTIHDYTGEQTRAVPPAKESRLLAVPARNWRVIWKRQSSTTVVGGHRDAVERAHRWLGGDVELRWVVRHFSLHLIRALVKPLGVISAAPSSPNPPLPAMWVRYAQLECDASSSTSAASRYTYCFHKYSFFAGGRECNAELPCFSAIRSGGALFAGGAC